MKMHVLSGGRLRLRKSVYVPEAEKSETIELPVPCVLLRHAQGNVLFDTGCHPATVTDAAARWGGMEKFMVPLAREDELVLHGLASLGLGPQDIDVVVNSHFHSDHCGCNEFFTRASVVCHRDELEAAQGPDGPQRGYVPADWQHPMPTTAIEGQYDLFGDGRIVLLPLPGHTPGSVGALAALERDGLFLLAGDAAALQVNLDRQTTPRNTWKADLALQSLQEVRRLQSTGATVIYGHDPAQWAQLRKGAQYYE
jgi:N-acyl homoserine lactone hydrolase